MQKPEINLELNKTVREEISENGKYMNTHTENKPYGHLGIYDGSKGFDSGTEVNKDAKKYWQRLSQQ